MLKDAIYQGLLGPLSRDDILAHIALHPVLTLRGIAEGAGGGTLIEVLHQASQEMHTLLYEPDEESGMLRLLAVNLVATS